jgi:DNA invertase Pin-like site-specific DNA recombinase
MIKAINTMMLDMLALIARKDYEDRKRRQRQGIEKAQREGRYKGKPINIEKHTKIKSLLLKKVSYSEIVAALGCSRATVAKVAKANKHNELET